MASWSEALRLDEQRRVVAGSPERLAQAIGGGADLRIGTEFVHNQHIDVTSDDPQPVREVAEFGITYLLDGHWTAGIMSLRQPIDLPVGFGPRPSMSFFLYNQDGQQGIARPFLDGWPTTGGRGRSPDNPPENMPKYHTRDSWDADTNAPCHNFIYDFGVFRYCVDETWEQVLAHGPDGNVVSGSLEALVDAFTCGCAIKIGVEGLCDDLCGSAEDAVAHEVFVQTGSAYYYTGDELLIAASHPVVRVKPGIPALYESEGWDFGWLMARTDGHLVYRRCDPYTLEFSDHAMRRGVRWFVR